MRHILPHLQANRWHLLLITLLPLLLFWQWPVRGKVLYWGTILLQFWPWYSLVKSAILQGSWPLWNPWLGNGTPLLANLQSAVFYPPNLVHLLLPVEHGLTLLVMVHLILAGWLMFIYGRSLQLSAFAATIAALCYMFSGYIIGRSQFIPMVHAFAWIPLLLYLTDRLVDGRGLAVVWLALALLLQLLAGHAQLWFYSLVLITAYLLFRSWQRPPKSIMSGFRALMRLALSVLLALLLAAVQILPTAEFLSQSPRNSGAERTFALTYSFWPWRLITLLSPDFFGNPAQGNYWGYANYWEDHAYVGVLPFILALSTIWIMFKRRKPQQAADAAASRPGYQQVVPFYAVLLPLSLILAMGWNTPIYLWVFDWLPGFAFFQAPARQLIWYTVAISVLAAAGAEQFEMTTTNRPGWQRFLAACIAIMIAGLAGAFLLSGRGLTFVTATRSSGILLVMAVIILLGQPRTRTTRLIRWQWLVMAFIALDLLWVAWPLLPMASPDIFRQPAANAELIKAQPGSARVFVDEQYSYTTTFQQYFQFKSFGPADEAHWQQFKETLVPNTTVLAAVPAANNNDPLLVAHWHSLLKAIESADVAQQTRLLSLMNVGYIVGRNEASTWPVIYADEVVTIQQLTEVQQRAYFVPGAIWVSDSSTALGFLLDPELDSHQEVIIIDDAASELNASGPAATLAEAVPVTMVLDSSNNVQVTFDAPSEGYLVLTDTFYPGWQATLNGQPVEILQANLAFRAVPVAAGQQQVSFSYRPRSFTFGLWLTGASLIASIAALLIFRKSR